METKEETKTRSSFSLPNKKVKVVPIKREGQWVEPGHDAHFLLTGAVRKYRLPKDSKTGKYVEVLTDEEKEFLESPNGLDMDPGDLNIYKTNNNFWDSFTVKLDKTTDELNLSDPYQYLQYKVLLANKDSIAPSEEDKLKKGTYKYAIVDEEKLEEKKAKKSDKMQEAYMAFGSIKDNREKMLDTLRVYGRTKRKNKKRVSDNSKKEFLISEIDNIIHEDIDGFLDVVKDNDLELKVLIDKAIACGALEKENNKFYLPGGDKIADSLKDCVDFFKDKENQDIYMKIKGRVDVAE